MLEKRGEKIFVLVNPLRRSLDLRDDLLRVFCREIRHRHVFDVIPARLDDVELRRVNRQSLEMKPLRMLPPITIWQADVTLKIVPDDDEFARKIFV